MTICAVIAASCSMGIGTLPRRFDYSQIHMGVKVSLSLYAYEQTDAERAAKAAFARFAELEQIMSDYRPDSEVMKLCDKAGAGPQPVSKDLFVVLAKAREVSQLSSGAFDVTCSPLVKLWRAARKSGKMPDPHTLEDARKLVDWRWVELNPASQTVSISHKGVRIDLGGIAKGYAGDQAIAAMAKEGVDRAFVEAGGDLVASGAPPGKLGWKVELKPGTYFYLHHGAISTSGNAFQYVKIAGKKYSHIVDPHTGLGLTTNLQVSIWAPNGLTSDPLSTTVCVLGTEQSTGVLDRFGAKLIDVRQ